VLVRRATHRIAKIDDRLELLEGYLIAYLNLDRVIQIIRTEDEPKPVMIAEFGLTDRQAEAILNMRLRSLRKLEEMEIKRERDALIKEREELAKLVDSNRGSAPGSRRTWRRCATATAPETELGRRRTLIEEAAPAREIPLDGDDRARADHRDHVAARLDPGDEGPCRPLQPRGDEVQGGRRPALLLPRPDHRPAAARRRERALLHARRRQAARRPRLRRAGAADGRHRRRGRDRRLVRGRARQKLLVASSDGRGFVTPATRRSPRPARASRWSTCAPAPGSRRSEVGAGDDYVGVIGDNRKMVFFPLAELPEMGRGQGVQLQRYRDGGLADATTFRLRGGAELGHGRRERPAADRDGPQSLAHRARRRRDGCRRSDSPAANRF
jgi:topoisomerase-4 subunit A